MFRECWERMELMREFAELERGGVYVYSDPDGDVETLLENQLRSVEVAVLETKGMGVK